MVRDLETLARGVEPRLNGAGPVTEVVPLSTGHSNETYLLRGPDIVLRTPPAGTGLLPPYDTGLPSYGYFTLPGMPGRDEVISLWERGTGRAAHDKEDA
jgi:aminoglycoside phosphotransferase (APT) family kinase protein